jgi:hypothetical protein
MCTARDNSFPLSRPFVVYLLLCLNKRDFPVAATVLSSYYLCCCNGFNDTSIIARRQHYTEMAFITAGSTNINRL